MTFSLLGRCPVTGALGIAVASSSPAVAARCAYVRAGTGAAASQNVTDPRLGPRLLERMAGGLTAPAAVELVAREAPQREYRQLAAVDAEGQTGTYSGERTLGVHAVAGGDGVVAAGNLLAAPEVVSAMVAGFAEAAGHLGRRLVAGLAAGLAAGGEEGAVRSAGLLVAEDVEWPVADLRVDWSDDPVGELAGLWALWEPQLGAYVARALDPAAAPSYGVPGDP